ncbi:MAG: Rrf2 family transcriptional regulator [Candidatus Omnitrophota bacterium]|nr:MAG: Rrf2 family transcriptional regulator [Candidatus Omnitrophota bacterium]
MKLLTKHTDYAIRALLELAGSKDEFLSAQQIAKRQRVPYQFLRQILQGLIKDKLVISKEGRGGGFRINKHPYLISIVDVIVIFQGNIQLSDCMFRKKLCINRANCVLRKQINRVEKLVNKEFKGITIGCLLRDLEKPKRRG